MNELIPEFWGADSPRAARDDKKYPDFDTFILKNKEVYSALGSGKPNEPKEGSVAAQLMMEIIKGLKDASLEFIKYRNIRMFRFRNSCASRTFQVKGSIHLRGIRHQSEELNDIELYFNLVMRKPNAITTIAEFIAAETLRIHENSFADILISAEELREASGLSKIAGRAVKIFNEQIDGQVEKSRREEIKLKGSGHKKMVPRGLIPEWEEQAVQLELAGAV